LLGRELLQVFEQLLFEGRIDLPLILPPFLAELGVRLEARQQPPRVRGGVDVLELATGHPPASRATPRRRAGEPRRHQAEWTLQQLREALPGDHAYRFLIHDRDAIYAPHLDQSIAALGLRVLRTPVQAPRANAFCERLIGTLRRECLDYLIPFGEKHLRRLLHEWKRYYNRARPHASLGPGFPQPDEGLPVALQPHRHRLPAEANVVAHPVLGGVHHDYRLETDKAA
jgi:hypothetical protein